MLHQIYHLRKMAATNFSFLHLLINFLWISLFVHKNMADDCPQQCHCHGNRNLTVDCSSLGLVSPPLTSLSTLTLNLSHNALGPIINASFVQMRDLTILDLSYNGLTRLLGCTLSGMLDLRTVRLGGNGLTSLPDSLFADSNKVEHLDVSFNQLTEIPDEVLRNLPELRSLDVSNNLIARLKLGLRFQVLTQLRTLDLSHNQFESIQANSFEASSDWTTVTPRTVNLAFCRISSIESGAFSPFSTLTSLDLSGNKVPIRNLNTAVNDLATKGLERLSISFMNLTSIEALFSETSELPLKFLNVSFNHITDLPQNVFSNAKNIQELDFSGNLIPSLTDGFTDLLQLRVLNISGNKFESFQGDAVQKLSSLHSLDLSHNKLNDFSRVNFSPLVNLNFLDVSNNILTSAILPSSTSNLQHIDYSFNKITSLTGIEDATKLTFADFSNNNIQILPGLLFKGARFLQVVNFSRNHITVLDHGTFLPQSSIVIDLSFNALKEVRYSNWVATQKLYIHHNQLVNIDSQSFYGMSGLEELDLSFNRLTTLHVDLFQYLTMLNLLNLSNNFLRNNNWFSLFRSLELLITLDLGHNNISTLNESSFHPLTHIQTISLRDNSLQNINPGVVSNIIDIKFIDLSNNPLDCSCDSLAFRDWIKKTDLNILGLYETNSTSYLCRTPRERVGIHVTQWSTAEFECDKSMLYVTVFCSTLVLLTIFALIGAGLHRYCVKRRSRKTRIKMDLKLEEERNKLAKKVEFVRLLEKELKREERQGGGKANGEKRNGYTSWPGGVKRESRGEKDRGGVGVEVREEMKSEDRRGYERSRKEELVKKDVEKRGQEERSRRSRDGDKKFEVGGRRDGNYQREGTRFEGQDFAELENQAGPSRSVPSQYVQVGRDGRIRREHERTPYPDGYPRHSNGPYIISASESFPTDWEDRRDWSDHPEWINHGYRKSGEGYPIADNYMPVPNGDRVGGRVESRSRSASRMNGGSNYPLEVQFSDRSDHRRPTSTRSDEHHNRNNYHQRSLSYNYLPQEYHSDTPFQKGSGSRGRDNSRQQIRPQAVIGHRAASQPYLNNDGTSGWL